MGITIISNNCSGARMQQDLKMQYQSPTVVLQILPEEYPKFCKNLKHYLSCEVKEYKEFSEIHKQQMMKLLGFLPTFPVGLLDDIAILFQHYETFADAKEKWDRRTKRVDYEHVGYMFVIDKGDYRKEAIEFGNLRLPNSVLFMRGCDVDVPIEHHRYDLVGNEEFLGRNHITKLRNFENGFDRKGFIRKIGGN